MAVDLVGVVEQLRSDGLIPPVRAVEVIGGGVIQVTVVAPLSAELRARLRVAMGSTRWSIREVKA